MKKRKLVKSFMGLYLSFLSCGVFAQENVGPIGTALAAEVNGNWYVVPTVKHTGYSRIQVLHVGFIDGKIILPEEQIDAGNWIIEGNRIHTSDYKYLFPANSFFLIINDNLDDEIPDSWERYWLDIEHKRYVWRFNNASFVNNGMFVYHNGDTWMVAYVPLSSYEKEPNKYFPVTDNPIYDGWYRHYDTEYLYSTFCPSRNVASVADISGAEFYALLGKVVDKTGQVTQLVFEGPCSRLDAGKSYLLKRQEGVQTVSVLYSGERKTEPVVTNGMTGSFAGISAGNELTGKYVLYQDRFVKCAKGSSLIQNGAYIDLDAVPELTTEIPFAALRFSLPQHNGTTTVEALQCEPGETLQIYSLSGKLLMKTSSPDWYSNLKSGIYIVNGKKIKK